jgi:predicted GIY-YIG superfamily endonuclease
MNRAYYVYILASRSRALYTGMTNDLTRRVIEHRQGLVHGFTAKYRMHRLVYVESLHDVRTAIAREKGSNATWDDLGARWSTPYPKQEKQVPRYRSG